MTRGSWKPLGADADDSGQSVATTIIDPWRVVSVCVFRPAVGA